MICTVDGCGRAAHARGWCSAHYDRWRYAGDPTAPHKNPAVGSYSLLCNCRPPDADPGRAFGQCRSCFRKPFALMADSIQARYPQFAGAVPDAD